jgi:hypothetical protein
MARITDKTAMALNIVHAPVADAFVQEALRNFIEITATKRMTKDRLNTFKGGLQEALQQALQRLTIEDVR